MIVMRLPDAVTLGRDPESPASLCGLQLLLMLVLGCAVQGPNKNAVVADIQRLPESTQMAIVACIQEVALAIHTTI